MRRHRLRELWNAGEPSLGTYLHISWPSIIELVGHSGMFDYVEFVAEYAPYDLYALENMGRAVDLFDYLSAMMKIEQQPRTYLAVLTPSGVRPRVAAWGVRQQDAAFLWECGSRTPLSKRGQVPALPQSAWAWGLSGSWGGGRRARPGEEAPGTLTKNLPWSAPSPARRGRESANAAGQPLDGYRLEDCQEFYGDQIAHPVQWKGGSDLGSLAGQPIRLRCAMRDADLYSFRFAPGEE